EDLVRNLAALYSRLLVTSRRLIESSLSYAIGSFCSQVFAFLFRSFDNRNRETANTNEIIIKLSVIGSFAILLNSAKINDPIKSMIYTNTLFRSGNFRANPSL